MSVPEAYGPNGATTSSVVVTIADGVGKVEINRPEKRNAIDSATADGITTALEGFSLNPLCRAVVVCGHGGDLSSGADLREPSGDRPRPALSPRTLMLRAIRSCDVPVIAAVDGWAVGLGVGIAGAASHAVAGEGARFTMPEAAMGFFPYAVAPYLVDRVRPETVLAWALSGRRFGAEEALASGLITEVCAAGEAETVATELAAALATAPRGVVEQATEWLRRYRTPVDPDETFVSWCEHRMAGVHAAGVKTSREEQ